MISKNKDVYDVVVLGGGAGGTPAAIRAAQLGGRVALIEKDKLGGLCMNRGCIPFGHMMSASGILGDRYLGEEMGVALGKNEINFKAMTRRQHELIDYMRLGVLGKLKKTRVEIIQGEGKIKGTGKITVNNKEIAYKNLILSTGGCWSELNDFGDGIEEMSTSDDLLTALSPPEKVVLYGKSPWVIEIAQFLRRIGSQVLLVIPDKDILADESKTIRNRLRKVLKQEGIEIRREGRIHEVRRMKTGLHVKVSSKTGVEEYVAESIIHSDRKPCLRDLGLEAVGIDEKATHLEVNRKMETGVKDVYAIGDITGLQSRHYSHVAAQGGIVAAENAMGQEASVDPRTFTRVLFTQPQVACVGMTPKEAKGTGREIVVGAAPYSMNPLGMILSERDGIVEIVSDRRYGEILGVHFIGKNVSEMAGQAIMAIQMEMVIEDLAKMPFPHPTLSESLVEAARDALGFPIYLP